MRVVEAEWRQDQDGTPNLKVVRRVQPSGLVSVVAREEVRGAKNSVCPDFPRLHLTARIAARGHRKTLLIGVSVTERREPSRAVRTTPDRLGELDPALFL